MVCAIWAITAGVLHDIFVVREHKGAYDRELLRLLMDGHVLITCGGMYLIAFILIRQSNIAGVCLSLLAGVSLLVYCSMIFPFLKSIVTMAMNFATVILALLLLLV
jgi:hypothetical protein